MPRIGQVDGNIYKQCPELWEALMLLYGVLWERGTLDPVVKDLCRLKSSFANGSRC